MSLFDPEIEMDFVVPLKDVSVPEKKQAKFECSITKDVSKVMWYRGDDIITPDQKYDIIDDGKKHMLIINCCEFDDEDEYTIAVLSKSSTARLTVEGKFCSRRSVELFASCCKLTPMNVLYQHDCRYQAEVYLTDKGPNCKGRKNSSI